MSTVRLRSVEAIVAQHGHAPTPGSHPALARLPAPVAQTLRQLAGVESSPDIVWMLDDGTELPAQGLDEPTRYVMVARSGAGDGWLLDTERGELCFFDHDAVDLRPDGPVCRLGLDFAQFVRVADAWAQHEAWVDAHPDPQALGASFRAALATLDADLPARWPYAIGPDLP